MARDRFTPRPLSARPSRPFDCAEEAWLWFWRCQLAREEGARYTADAGEARPCDPDDVYRAAAQLHRRRTLSDGHVRVLAGYGRRLAPPDSRLREEEAAARLWDEALDRLATPLRAKGIVALPEAAAMGEVAR